MGKFRRALIAALVLALLTVACGDDDAAMTTTAAYTTEAAATTAAPATTEAPSEALAIGGDAGEDAPAGPATDAEGAAAAQTPEDLGRLIVYTAAIAVEVADVVTAGEEAQVAVAGLGGILFGQETVTGDNPRSVLTIKVPPRNFHSALERLGGVGKLLSQSVYADDVTERVVDLQSQIITGEASVERLRTFLADASDLEKVIEFEQELLNREAALETMRGRLRTLEDQVSLATITLILTEPQPDVPEPAIEVIQTGYEGHDGGAGCPGAESARVDEDAAYTMCVLVINTGDTALDEIEFTDRGLKVDHDDLSLISGDPEVPLLPEGTLLFFYEGEGNPRRSTDPAVQMIAVDEDGEQIRVEIGRTIERFRLNVIEDDSLPGFMDALTAAWRVLQKVFGVALVLTAAAIPFLWVPILAGAAIWLWRRRERQRAEENQLPPLDD